MLALVTATRNSMQTLPDTLASIEPFRSVVKQFVIDGASTDGTEEHLRSLADTSQNMVVMAQEGTGLYPALNQGVIAALEDPDVTYIGMLHSDDRLIIENFSALLSDIQAAQADVYYSDIQYHNISNEVVRVWQSGRYSRIKLNTGWMPPHTSMIVAKNVYYDVGLYSTEFGTAADYEWIVRVLTKYGDQSRYFPASTLSMLVGGASDSSVRARLRANAMDGKVWAGKSLLQSIVVRICKPVRKLGQFLVR